MKNKGQTEVVLRKPMFTWLVKWRFKSFSWDINIIAYGRKIYCRTPVTGHVLSHEHVHLEQQEHSSWLAFWWWVRYFLSAQFRYEQELEAYQEQYRYARDQMRLDRNQLQSLAGQLAGFLSGPLYNHCTSFEQALKEIKDES